MESAEQVRRCPGNNALTKGVVIMAIATRKSRSPYAAATLEEAYAIWCDRIFPMHKAAGRLERKPRFQTWCKTHADKFNEFHTNMGASSAAQVRGKDKSTLVQQLAEILRSMGVEVEDDTLADDLREDAVEYAEPRETPEDAARNAVLWRLNKDGLLADAVNRAADAGLDYITQEIGSTLLTETFGPLER